MLETVLRSVAPVEVTGPLVAIGVAWAAVHYLYVGPEIGARLAAREHLPTCLAGLEVADSRAAAEHEARRARIEATRQRLLAEADARAQALREEAARLEQGIAVILGIGPLGDLTDAFDPDGTLRDAITGTLPRVPDMPEVQLPAMPPPMSIPTPAGREDACTCAVDTVLARSRAAYAGYSATLTAWVPQDLAGFDAAVAKLAEQGACARPGLE